MRWKPAAGEQLINKYRLPVYVQTNQKHKLYWTVIYREMAIKQVMR